MSKSRKVTASELTQRLTLQVPIYSQDELGGAMVSWQDAPTLWAAIKPLRGSERFTDRRVQSRNYVEIRIRWRAGVLPSYRFTQGNRVFHILAVADVDEAGHTLEITAEELS